MPELTAEKLKSSLERQGPVGIMTHLEYAGVDQDHVTDVAVHVRAMLYVVHANLAFAEKRKIKRPVHVMTLHSSDYAGIPSVFRPNDLGPIASTMARFLTEAGATMDIVQDRNNDTQYDLVIVRD